MSTGRTSPPADPDAAPRLSPTAVRSLLYLGHQGLALERSVNELAETGDLDPRFLHFGIDPRAMVIAHAMRHASDGSGDACYAGAASPGPSLAFGATPLEFLRHCARRGTRPSAARVGGTTWTDRRRGLWGWNGQPGIMTQVMTGVALAFLQRGEARAAIAFEPAACLDTGAWHEGINFAAAQRAPLIIVLLHGAGRGRSPSPGQTEAAARAYGAGVAFVAGEAFLEIRRIAEEARSGAVAGRGPTIIQLDSDLPVEERWSGLGMFAEWVEGQGLLPSAELEKVRENALADVQQAVTRLRREPGPNPTDALALVLADQLPPVPPWTRQDPPSPESRAPAQPPGGPLGI